MVILEMKNVNKSFRDLEVIKDISISVSEGEVVTLIGPSGSGKSTLLRCATLLETMDKGSLKYCDACATTNKSTEQTKYVSKKELHKLREYFELVFQNYNLFPHFSVLKNVCDAPIHVQKRDPKEVEEFGKKLIGRLGISAKENSYPCELSGGQQQRVAIARALAMKPRMVFFDEPTSALDPEATLKVVKTLRSLAERNMAILVVTHDIDFARKVSDRVIFMAKGLIVEEGSPEQVIDNPKNERTREFLQKSE